MSRILLVEDDEYITRVYERAFRLSGHEINIVSDGESAWKQLTERAVLPDAIIIDIGLPGMSGSELLAKIDAEARLNALPVVILTNTFNEEIEQKTALRRGGYISSEDRSRAEGHYRACRRPHSQKTVAGIQCTHMAKLFIAEDDPLMSRMYERAFRLGGHELTITGDGEEALTTLMKTETNPQVILLDVMMPKMSGFDVLRKIKEDARLKSIPVILLTNLAGEQDAQKGLELGAIMYLVKSQYNPKQVVAKVEEIIAASSRGEGVPEVKVEIKDIPAAAPAAPATLQTPPIPPAPPTP